MPDFRTLKRGRRSGRGPILSSGLSTASRQRTDDLAPGLESIVGPYGLRNFVDCGLGFFDQPGHLQEAVNHAVVARVAGLDAGVVELIGVGFRFVAQGIVFRSDDLGWR